jgi:hypothetical protein
MVGDKHQNALVGEFVFQRSGQHVSDFIVRQKLTCRGDQLIDKHKTIRFNILFYLKNPLSYTTKSRKATIYWHDNACDESRCWRDQPQQGAEQILRIAKTRHRSV